MKLSTTPPTDNVKKKKKLRQFRFTKKIKPIITVTMKMISLEPINDTNFMTVSINAVVFWSAQYATVSSIKNPDVPDVKKATIINKNKKTAATINKNLFLVWILTPQLSLIKMYLIYFTGFHTDIQFIK